MRVESLLASVFVLSAAGGCSLLYRGPTIEEHVGLVAVMPLERAEPVSATLPEVRPRSEPAAERIVAIERAETTMVTPPKEPPRLEPGAEQVVTAQIYAVLSESSKWRFVPDSTVMQVLSKVGSQGDLVARAQALGKAVGADAVLCGTVSRFVERVGSEYGARKPAAVGFTLQLISVPSGKVLWTGSFDQQQEALTTNLFNWWQFWRGGPKWFTAQEFARLGAEHLLDDLSRKIR